MDSKDPAVYDATEPGTLVDSALLDSVELPAPGYTVEDVIGRGGMGEVVSALDRRIGRHVAIKRMRSAQPTLAETTRFLREARIQARLDHPAIAPVHELGVDDAGRPYFTMKRLAGITLAQRLVEGADLRPMLRAFVDVCLAVGYAHAKRIVHRDLKPANIMLGDFGEVYVLDWGVARVLADRRAPSHGADRDDIDTLDGSTRAGDMLGTPGYMAPEQMRGEPVECAADVYALGAILFELLAAEPLHPRGEPAIASTLANPQQAPAQRRPERQIPPELDQACREALAEIASDRPSARALADRVQRYLDGDRDVERRRAVARDEVAAARRSLESGDPEQRATAFQAASRALALDPDSVEAAQVVGAMVIEPPAKLPADLERRLAADDTGLARDRMRLATFTLMSTLMFVAMLPWVKVASWTSFAGFYAAIAAVTTALAIVRRRGKPSALFNLAGGTALAFAFSRVAGPLVLTPIVITGTMQTISPNRWLIDRIGVLLAWIALCTLGPLALEALGVFGHTLEVAHGGLLSTSTMFALDGTTGGVVVFAANIVLVAALTVYSVAHSRIMRDQRRRLSVQSWHLDQLLARGARERAIVPAHP